MYKMRLSAAADLRAVDDLQPLSFPEAEVVLRPCLVVVKCHEDGDSYRRKSTASDWKGRVKPGVNKGQSQVCESVLLLTPCRLDCDDI